MSTTQAQHEAIDAGGLDRACLTSHPWQVCLHCGSCRRCGSGCSCQDPQKTCDCDGCLDEAE